MEFIKDKVIITADVVCETATVDDGCIKIIEHEKAAAQCYDAWENGAAIININAGYLRGDTGNKIVNLEDISLIIEKVKTFKGFDGIIRMTVNASNEGEADNIVSVYKKCKAIEMGTIYIDSFNIDLKRTFINQPDYINTLYTTFKQENILPAIEMLDEGMLTILNAYVKNEVMETPKYADFTLGVIGGMEAQLDNILYLTSHLPENTAWSVAAFGKGYYSAILSTLALEGNLRVGMEKDPYGTGNAMTISQLVVQATSLIKEYNKTPATAAEVREYFGLTRREK